MKLIRIIAAALFCVLTFTTAIAQSADPLPSWNASKASNPSGPSYQRLPKRTRRILCRPPNASPVDNDGTLGLSSRCNFNSSSP